LFEEEFIHIYHLGQDWQTIQKMPIYERKWLIDRFVEQKKAEEERMQSATRKTRR